MCGLELGRDPQTNIMGLEIMYNVVAAGIRAASQRFMAYGADKLRNVERFKDLGWLLLHNNNAIPFMRQNLKQACVT